MSVRKLVLAFAIVTLSSTASSVEHIIHERRSDVLREQWTQGSRVQNNTVLPVRVGLAQQNLEFGAELLSNLSDPRHPSYGKHLKADEVIELFSPRNESIKRVTSWLTRENIHVSRLRLSPNKQWIMFDAKASELKRLLRTEFYKWSHKDTAESGIASQHYHIPTDLLGHVDYIVPGVRLVSRHNPAKVTTKAGAPRIRKRDHLVYRSSENENCGSTFAPICTRELYNISGKANHHPGNDLGFFEAGTNGFSQSDFDKFTKHYWPHIPPGFAPKMHSVDGTTITTSNDAEEVLDAEVAAPIIFPQGFQTWQVGTNKNDVNGTGATWNSWLDAIDGSYCNYSAYGETGDDPHFDPVYPDKSWPHPAQCGVFKPTNVISISYVAPELSFPARYLERQCSEYMKLGLRGVTVVVSSGDFGVSDRPGKVPQTAACEGPDRDLFSPFFPSTCPYVLTVGATIFEANREVAVGFSGGGFSNVWASPLYSSDQASTYLSNYNQRFTSYSDVDDKPTGYTNPTNGSGLLTYGGEFNNYGRGLPDVAAVGVNIPEVTNGADFSAEGTSAAAPVWAGIITRINGARLTMGKSTVGFVNKALYLNPTLMNDVISGTSYGCDHWPGLSPSPPAGWNASIGWDPVTGLGSPNYGLLLDYFTHIP